MEESGVPYHMRNRLSGANGRPIWALEAGRQDRACRCERMWMKARVGWWKP